MFSKYFRIAFLLLNNVISLAMVGLLVVADHMSIQPWGYIGFAMLTVAMNALAAISTGFWFGAVSNDLSDHEDDLVWSTSAWVSFTALAAAIVGETIWYFVRNS